MADAVKAVLLFWALRLCIQAAFANPVSRFSVSSDKLVDLSHTFDRTTVYWPTLADNETFRLTTIEDETQSDGVSYRIKFYEAAEHGGTHLDAPSHFSKIGLSVEKIPLDKLMGPAVIIDVREKAARNLDYQVTVQDAYDWEKKYGRIPNGAFVFMNSGWDAFWPDKKKIFNFDNSTGVETYHFPAFHPNTTAFLVFQRYISGLGVDTPSTDYGQAAVFKTHEILANNSAVGFENVKNLGKLASVGAHVIAIPIKITDGTGAPLGLIGINP
ncbi:hypothetical protein RvY_15496 [Ramazzottius varieornatus]|uniref:Cyclase n=1 Tax=Ramazzottius varieornatus TaxID=947166 RepID=A0A1D1VZS6_RAMVA|nr:hypothetical protein RvY_15496 [Ramazzottius varieornatus]